MSSYLYPTKPHWFDLVITKWKSSGKRYLCFPFLGFEPHPFHHVKPKEFWLYHYYSEKKTEEKELQRVVQYRAKVVQHSLIPVEGKDVYLHKDGEAKIYFKCAVVEEIRKEDGSDLTIADFSHVDKNKHLPSAIRKSIAPVIRISAAITVQRTMYWLND